MCIETSGGNCSPEELGPPPHAQKSHLNDARPSLKRLFDTKLCLALRLLEINS